MMRQRRHDFRRRERNVQEKTDLVLVAALAQRLGEGQEMIIVHPDHVVRQQHLLQFIGEMIVDAQIAGQIAAREFREIEPVMQDRPQHAVGEAVVIFVVILLRQVGHDIRNVVGFDRFGLEPFAGRASAPAEPDARDDA